MRYVAPLLAFFFLAVAMTATPASAQPYRARQGVQSGEVRSLDEILNGIRRERPGNLADVQGPNVGPAGDPRYRLKWLTPDGRVLWLDTDARTGRVLGVEGDDRPPQRGAAPPPGAFGYPGRRGNFRGEGPPPGYEGPPPGYGGPPPGYGGPPPGYNGPPPGYGGPPRGRGFGGRFPGGR